jgi:flagellar assembly protein FliH
VSGVAVHRYRWDGSGEPHLYLVSPGQDRHGAHAVAVPEEVALPGSAAVPTAEQEARLAALEREAFTKGYASGERAGVEAGARRADGMLRRVAQTVEELSQLRRTITRDTQAQMVQLALALAKRVVQRELSLDPDLVAALAHVAVQRLGEQVAATIRLHPEDYATVLSHRGEQWEGAQVTLVPDAAVQRGGCIVESEFGIIDATIDAQFAELSRALLGDASTASAPGEFGE